ncbi:MAG: hypothetical protein A2Y97_02920 [Nitrospirae bacterium RBG_13_39_12]|nr:MAG: hypothetical protein A2Y97_02920 [Nitrospirae bacterium RBG_13_39_12]
MIFDYAEYSYFIVLNKTVNKKQFLKKAQVESNSFAGELMARIYDALTCEIVNVVDEYRKYYAREYVTFEEFLYKKYSIDEKLIKDISKEMARNKVLYHGEKYADGDYSIGQLIFSDEMLQRINQILKGE